MLSKPVASAILMVVTAIWVINFAAQFIPGLDYKPDPIYHAVFMSLVGGALAFTKRSDEPPRPPDPPEPGDLGGRHRRGEGP